MFFVVGIFNSTAQTNTSRIWQDVSEGSILDNQNRQIIPQEYRTLSLNIAELKNILTRLLLNLVLKPEHQQ
jgi:hypothetical protein